MGPAPDDGTKPDAQFTAPAIRIMLVADTQGCIELSLPAGQYRITARLTGFNNLTRNKIRVSLLPYSRVPTKRGFRADTTRYCSHFAGKQ